MNSTRKIFSIVAVLLFSAVPAASQVVLSGRLQTEKFSGSRETQALSAVRVFASRAGSLSEPISFRTWETHPAGWYHLSGGAGNYTILFSSPAHYLRPLVLTNVYTRDGDILDRVIRPDFDVAVFDDGSWDEEPAVGYYQEFQAGGTGITHVGFKLATDGIDGAGPGGQDFLISIHRKGPGAPDSWKQVGPPARAIQVDCGGPKGYWYSVGWNSGEVPTMRGDTYAVFLRAADLSATVQAFWKAADGAGARCYRLGKSERGYRNRHIWLAVDSDGDGLLIPYNKRVHRKYHQLTRFGPKWTQTYVAAGRGLAGIILYAAVHGTQPPLSRQRVRVRVRQGGPRGKPVGLEKIAVGNGNYTGDASWGTFGLAYAPGEVPLAPGEAYAVEFESIETHHTLHGFVNIKGQVSNEKPGFNPYRKCPPDDYPRGKAYFLGVEEVDYDLDLQIIEYEHRGESWQDAVDPENLLPNGDMESGHPAGESSRDRAASWREFARDPGTAHEYTTDGPRGENRILRVSGGDPGGKTVDGGYVQRVDGLSHLETYRLEGRVRSTWPITSETRCLVGYDPTGQTGDPSASTIRWALLPDLQGIFVPHRSDPIRPQKEAISIWLRGRCTKVQRFPFQADFDDFSLRRVRTEVPEGQDP